MRFCCCCFFHFSVLWRKPCIFFHLIIRIKNDVKWWMEIVIQFIIITRSKSKHPPWAPRYNGMQTRCRFWCLPFPRARFFFVACSCCCCCALPVYGWGRKTEKLVLNIDTWFGCFVGLIVFFVWSFGPADESVWIIWIILYEADMDTTDRSNGQCLPDSRSDGFCFR